MTALTQVRAKPPAVQVIIKAHMTKASLEDTSPIWEQYAAGALDWWHQQYAEATKLAPGISENAAAELMVTALRHMETWDKILRAGTQ